jgi:predicted permease
MSTLFLLLPDLALIAIGFALSRATAWGRPFWNGLEQLVYFVLFPALLFQSVLGAPLSFGQAFPALAATGVALVAAIGVGLLALPLLRPPPLQFASGVQCAFRFNSYVALALAQRLGGDEGLALCALIAGFVVPAVNIVAVLALARHAGSNVLLGVLRNPLVLATLAGLAGNFLGLQLPAPLAATVSRLSAAALATGLLTVGAGLVLQPADQEPAGPASRRLAAWLTATKLLLMPAVAVAWVTWQDLPPLTQVIVVMFAAVPTASTCYILAARMGGDGPYVARLTTLSMLGALVTLPAWVAWIR